MKRAFGKNKIQRVNITLPIADFEKLWFLAELEGVHATTMAQSLIKKKVRELAKKNNYIEGALPENDLFDVPEVKAKKR